MQVNIVTPRRKLVEKAESNAVWLPSAKGQLQILPGHRELMTQLDTGILTYTDESGQKHHYALSYGFAEVSDDTVTVLAETCEPASEVDVKRAQEAQQRAESAIANLESGDQFSKHQFKLQRAMVRQQVTQK